MRTCILHTGRNFTCPGTARCSSMPREYYGILRCNRVGFTVFVLSIDHPFKGLSRAVARKGLAHNLFVAGNVGKNVEIGWN
jgi:hypothetical protein